MRSFPILLFFLTLLSLPATAQDDPKSKTIMDKLMAEAKTWKSFEADFTSR